MANLRNKSTKYKVVQYATGLWMGKWVVVEIVEQDVAAVLTEAEANLLKNRLERADRN